MPPYSKRAILGRGPCRSFSSLTWASRHAVRGTCGEAVTAVLFLLTASYGPLRDRTPMGRSKVGRSASLSQEPARRG